MSLTHEILERLIAFPTVSAESNLALIGYVDDFLTARGFETHLVPDDSGRKAGLFASLGPCVRGGLLLSGHTDVVPVQGQEWSRDPFRLSREDGRLYGRGTTDMKGYLACVLALADRAAGRQLRAPLKLAFSYDEEVGCVGIRHMIGRLEDTIGLPEWCFVGEPTQMQVAVGHKGKAALRATFAGQAGHSALAPRFLNALHPAAEFIGELRSLQEELARSGARDDAYEIPYSTLHAGRMQGGSALNIVPDQAVIEFELRHLAGDDAGAILGRIRDRADTVVQRFRGHYPTAAIAIDEVNAYPGLATPEDSAVVRLAQALTGTRGTTKVAFGTEAGFFADMLGVPTVVFGPGSMTEQGHKPDESIAEADLAHCDAALDRALDMLAGERDLPAV